ncbi:MAG TPA: endo-1,4-beta-xylanase [Anaerolineales bacterium]|nr:endo-1,4-beta-xylanase [Anaerolineales bacterium]
MNSPDRSIHETNRGIRNNRMANATVTILKADRTPLINQEVLIQQTRHKFVFGTAAFDLVPLANGEYEGEIEEQAEGRAEKLLALFNYVTLPFYWARFEPERGKPMTEALKNAAKWCIDHHLPVKGHPLCWHTLTADWLLSMDNSEILQAQLARIKREVSDFCGLIDMWDVINEAVIMPVFDKYDNGLTRLCKEMGRIKTIKAMFEAARAENPSATLLLNDFDMSPAYDILVEGCLEAGIKIDVIGIQSHMHQGYWGVERTSAILDHFSRFNLPIHFTETTLVSGHLMPPEIVDLNDYQVEEWPTTPEGEERQAQEALQHYKTLFAHPLVEGITWWDMSDGGWLHAPAGLIRKDGSSKPAYEELLKLIKEEWWIAPTRFTTDESGKLHFTGFEGDYELKCNGKRGTFSLTKQGATTIELQV